MKQKEYIRKTAKKLQCSKKEKEEFIRQLTSDIESALECGETWEAIQKRLGTPDEAAQDFNENLGERAIAYRHKKTLILRLVIGIAVLVCTILSGGIYFTQFNHSQTAPKATPSPAAEIQKKEAAIKASHEIINRFNTGDYKEILRRSDAKVSSSLSVESLKQAKKQVMPDAGEFQRFENDYANCLMEKDVLYTTVQTKAVYQKQTIIFTISWDDKNQLCGFYLKSAT